MKNWRGTLEAHVTNWIGAVPDKWVPRYIYHFTDVQNAAMVLRSGELLSRAEATARGAMRNDNAAGSVIENTPAAHKQFARLYFRPRTPTQFRSEGIRLPNERYYGAHCPVPVFLAFDLIETVLQDGVSFSDGNMASTRVVFGDSEQFFRSLPFHLIYHDGPFCLCAAGRDCVSSPCGGTRSAKPCDLCHAEVDSLSLTRGAGNAAALAWGLSIPLGAASEDRRSEAVLR